MSLRGEIFQVSLSPGGIPKLAVAEAFAGPLGLEGDAQRDTRHHGGPRQALLLVSLEDVECLQQQRFPVGAGSLGENLTVRGIDFRALRPGMRFRAGDAVIELTKLRSPCANLDVYNGSGARIQLELFDSLCKAGDASSPRWGRGGFYAAVLQSGLIRTGDILELADFAV